MLRPPLAGRRIARRSALRAAFATLAGLAGAEAVGLFAPFLRVTRVAGLGGPVAAGRVDEVLATFSATNDKPIQNRGGRFFLLRAPGGIVAAYAKCTHLGCIVPFSVAEDRFHCPCHHSVYDKRTAVVLDGPAPKPLQLFHVADEGGTLIVDTNPLNVIDRPQNRWDPAHLELHV